MANDNKAWYEDIIRKGTLRSSGMNEITENNPLDWTRLRVLEDGKLIPAMANGHIGAPSALDLDLLRDAAEKGNLFLYRMGEEYPQRLVDGVWYSMPVADGLSVILALTFLLMEVKNLRKLTSQTTNI